MAAKKLIVITGGSRGCGRALVEWLAGEGHTVVSCARTEAAVKELRERLGAPHAFAQVDVTDAKAVSAWAQGVIGEHGVPDLLVNNAAVVAQNAPLWTVPPEQVNAVLQVNVAGTVNTIRAFTPAMIAEGRGVIVNFSSGWGRSTSPDVAIYCASKYAIEGLTQALSQELPEGLAAVALNPGIIDTEMLRSCFGSGAANYPKPAVWVRKAGPFLLKLSARDNGLSLDVPGIPVD
jgi:NAD(P)-dependent dehydrogenase (short-subunit alcohol dehydrogenase family)